MLVVKIVLISSIFAFAVTGKLVMDDITSEASPDYLGITATIDKSGAEPIVNVDVDLFKDITNIDVKVSLLAKIAGEFKEIYPVKDFNPCKDVVEDEFVKYAMDQIETFGNLSITCPFKAGHYVVRNFRMDNDEKAKSFGNGQFRVDVEAISIENGAEIRALKLMFAFHSE